MEITVNGFYQFGGISDDDSLVNNDLYYLDSSSKWNYIDIYDEKPNVRYGMIMIAFNQQRYLLVLGDKDKLHQYIKDIWVFDIEDNTWLKIGDLKCCKFPKRQISNKWNKS